MFQILKVQTLKEKNSLAQVYLVALYVWMTDTC